MILSLLCQERFISTIKLRTPTSIDYHSRQHAVDDVVVVVKVQHGNAGHFSGTTTWTSHSRRLCLLDEMSMRVLLHENEWTFS